MATAFLNGELDDEEDVYVRMPAALGGGTLRLLKALYGLKLAARVWYVKLRSELVVIGFTAADADPCLFLTGKGMQSVYVLVHVDDGLIIGAKKTGQAAVAAIAGAFDIKDIGERVYFLGLDIDRDRTRGLLWLEQPKYARSILERFGMETCKAVTTPLEANAPLCRGQGEALTDEFPFAEFVGSLLYLTVNTRPDLAHAASVLGRFTSCATQVNWKAAKRVLRYLAESLDRGLVYKCGAPLVERTLIPIPLVCMYVCMIT